MNKNIACAWGHAELRSILKDYFSGEIEKPLIIFSKPFSGRTSAIKETAESSGIDYNNDVFNTHIYRDPFGKDEEMDVLIEQRITEDPRYDRKYRILEIDPNWMAAMPDDVSQFAHKRMDNGIGLIDYYESDNYYCVFFRPSINDWIEWATRNGITPEVVDFAKEYPAFYAITYDVYNRLNRALSNFRDIKNFQSLGYSGFMYQMTKPLAEKFTDYLLGTRFKEVIESAQCKSEEEVEDLFDTLMQNVKQSDY